MTCITRPLALLALALLAGCGDAEAAPIAPIAAPARSAIQDRAMRGLVMDIAEHRACALLRDRFVPLPEEASAGLRRTVLGRLWVSDCRVAREDDRLTIHVGGRGWRWVERTAPGPFGSRFTVRGTVRLEAAFDLTSEVDVRHDEDGHRLILALTPSATPRARVTPIGAIPLEPAGGWSSIIGGLGGLLGASPRDQARPLLEEEGARSVERELSRGATLVFDLCSSQVDVLIGALGDGLTPPEPPFAGPGVRWLDNARVELHPGAIDLAGPWDSSGGDLAYELEVESGGPVEVALFCRPEAALAASAYLAGGEPDLGAALSRRTVGGAGTLAIPRDACAEPHVLLRAARDTTLRYRIRQEGLLPEALVDCE